MGEQTGPRALRHVCCASILLEINNLVHLGHTKLIPWSSDFVFENKERASEIFIFVHLFLQVFVTLWSG